MFGAIGRLGSFIVKFLNGLLPQEKQLRNFLQKMIWATKDIEWSTQDGSLPGKYSVHAIYQKTTFKRKTLKQIKFYVA